MYIDDLLIYGDDDDTFVQNERTIFQKCREKNVTLSAKKLNLGIDTVQFVRNELDSTGINIISFRRHSHDGRHAQRGWGAGFVWRPWLTWPWGKE